jgi:hypothetical protein
VAFRYIEATAQDIALANELASQALGRSLDKLPPQTRRLLMLIEKMAAQACAKQGVERCDYRFSRRQVREAAGWSQTQLRVHLERLVELEYLIVHRGGRGQQGIFGFTGAEREPDTDLGLIRMGARWYALRVGRWVSPDPMFL